jgi:hypothetical protein
MVKTSMFFNMRCVGICRIRYLAGERAFLSLNPTVTEATQLRKGALYHGDITVEPADVGRPGRHVLDFMLSGLAEASPGWPTLACAVGPAKPERAAH